MVDEVGNYLKSLLPSIVRTFVPLIVGYIVSIPLIGSLDVTSDQWSAAITVLVSAAWYLIARLGETFISPYLSILLLSRSQPVKYMKDEHVAALKNAA